MGVEKEVILSGVSRQRQELKELLEALEPKNRLLEEDMRYCDEVLKRVEATLRQLRKARYDHGKYAGSALYRLIGPNC